MITKLEFRITAQLVIMENGIRYPVVIMLLTNLPDLILLHLTLDLGQYGNMLQTTFTQRGKIGQPIDVLLNVRTLIFLVVKY